MTNGFEITLKGASFGDVIAQAKALILAAEKFGDDAPAVTTTKTKTKTAPVKLATVAADDELAGDIEVPDETELDGEAFDLGADEDDAPAPKVTAGKKETKSKKVTDKDVNTAAMAHAKVHGRNKTLAVLTKKFKVKSILELKPDQYPAAIAALEA